MDSQKLLDAIYAGNSIDGVEIQRLGGDTNGQLERIKVPIQNLGQSEDAGVDANIAYQTNASGLGLNFASNYSTKLYSKELDFPGAALSNTLGERGKPAWRWVNSVNIGIASHVVGLRNNRIAGTKAAQGDERIGEFSTFDTQYTWNHKWGGSITLGALNVLDTDFPRDNTERAGDDTRVEELYSPNGRTYYAQMNQVF